MKNRDAVTYGRMLELLEPLATSEPVLVGGQPFMNFRRSETPLETLRRLIFEHTHRSHGSAGFATITFGVETVSGVKAADVRKGPVLDREPPEAEG